MPSKPFVHTLDRVPDDIGIFKKLVTMLITGKSIDNIKSELNKTIKNYRAKLCVGNPDGECNTARRRIPVSTQSRAAQAGGAAAAAPLMPSQVLYYKSSTERNAEFRAAPPAAANGIVITPGESTIKTVDGAIIKPFSWVKNAEGKQVAEGFAPTYRGYCGDCWICGQPVYFYADPGNSANNGNITGCGECEHIGGIVASLLTGMLTSGTNNIMIYNYGAAHVHCNQRKSDYLSMYFNIQTGLWDVDANGAEIIAKRIINTDVHASEYDPEFIRFLKAAKLNPEQAIQAIKARIIAYTHTWCAAANANLINPPNLPITAKAIRIARSMNTVVRNRIKFLVKAPQRSSGGATAPVAQTLYLKKDEYYKVDDEFFTSDYGVEFLEEEAVKERKFDDELYDEYQIASRGEYDEISDNATLIYLWLAVRDELGELLLKNLAAFFEIPHLATQYKNPTELTVAYTEQIKRWYTNYGKYDHEVNLLSDPSAEELLQQQFTAAINEAKTAKIELSKAQEDRRHDRKHDYPPDLNEKQRAFLNSRRDRRAGAFLFSGGAAMSSYKRKKNIHKDTLKKVKKGGKKTNNKNKKSKKNTKRSSTIHREPRKFL